MRYLAAAAVVAVLAVGCGDEHADPMVVRVELEGATNAAETATGFVARPGRVVTVAHVLDPSRRLVIRAGGKARRGRVLRIDRRNDLALIAVRGVDGASARLHPHIAGDASVRILVIRAGAPTSLDAHVRRPIRATVRTSASGPYRRRALELDARVRLGDSGAPVVDSEGQIAGVLFARLSNGRPTAYAVDSSAIGAFTSR